MATVTVKLCPSPRCVPLALALCVVPALAAPVQAQEANGRAEALARKSPSATRSMAYLQQRAAEIKDPLLRRTSLELLDNPAPGFMERLGTPEARAGVRQALVSAGLLDAKVTVEALFPPLHASGDARRAPLSFLAAPGSPPDGHHAYPGGLAEHTAFNVQASLGLGDAYRERNPGLPPLSRDYLVAAPLAHDAMKAWCLQWHKDGTMTVQVPIAGTASHHIFVVAEAFHRRLPADFLVTLASAHDAPLGDTAARVVGFLRAGAILAGVDPIASGVLRAADGGYGLAATPRIEAPVNHLADHDYVLTNPAERIVTGALGRLIRATPEGKGLDEGAMRWARYRILGQVTLLRLYAAYASGGDEGVRAALGKERVALVAKEDGP